MNELEYTALTLEKGFFLKNDVENLIMFLVQVETAFPYLGHAIEGY